MYNNVTSPKDPSATRRNRRHIQMSPDEFYSGVYPRTWNDADVINEALSPSEGIPIDEEIRYLDDTGLETIYG